MTTTNQLSPKELSFLKTQYASKMINELTQDEKDNALFSSAIDTLESYTQEELISEMKMSYSEVEIEDLFDTASR